MSQIAVYDYFYGTESEQYSFYRIPRLLVTGEQFKELSIDAKLLYGLMLDRMALSAKNGWYDENGRVYIYYTLAEIMEALNCGHDRALRMLTELDGQKGIGLIERRKQGQGKPTKIYVKRFTSKNASLPHDEGRGDNFRLRQSRSADFGFSEVKSSDLPTSRLRISRSADFGISDINNTDKNNTYSAISIESYPSGEANGTDRENCMRDLKQRVDYDRLLERYRGGELDEILELIVEVLCSSNATIRVNGGQIPIRFVKDRFQSLDRFHIEYVIDSLRENTTSVRNIRAYLLTTLYNAPVTIDHYYQAKVQHDLYGQ